MKVYVLEKDITDISFVPLNSIVFKDGCGYIKHSDLDLVWDDLKSKYKGVCTGEYSTTIELLKNEILKTSPIDKTTATGIKIVISGEFKPGFGATISEIKFKDKLGNVISLNDKIIDKNLTNPEFLDSTDWNFSNIFDSNITYTDEISGKSSSALFNVNLSRSDEFSEFTVNFTPDEIYMMSEIEIIAGSVENRIPNYIAVYLVGTSSEILLNKINFINKNNEPIFTPGLIKLGASESATCCSDFASQGATKSGIYYITTNGIIKPIYCDFNKDHATGLSESDLVSEIKNVSVLGVCTDKTGDQFNECMLKNVLYLIDLYKNDPSAKISVLNPSTGQFEFFSPIDYLRILGIDLNYLTNLSNNITKDIQTNTLTQSLIDYINSLNITKKTEFGLSPNFEIAMLSANLSYLTLSISDVVTYTDATFIVDIVGYLNNNLTNLVILPSNQKDLTYKIEEFFSVENNFDIYGKQILDELGAPDIKIISNARVTFTTNMNIGSGEIRISDGFSTKKINYVIKERKLELFDSTNTIAMPHNTFLKINSEKSIQIKYFGLQGPDLHIVETNNNPFDLLNIKIEKINKYEGIITLNAHEGEKTFNLTIFDGTSQNYYVNTQVYNEAYFLTSLGEKVSSIDVGNVYVDECVDNKITDITIVNSIIAPFLITNRYYWQNYYYANYESLKFTSIKVSESRRTLSLFVHTFISTNNLNNKTKNKLLIAVGYFNDGTQRRNLSIAFNLKHRLLVNNSLNYTVPLNINIGRYADYAYQNDLMLRFREGSINITIDDPTVAQIGKTYYNSNNVFESPLPITYFVKPLKIGKTMIRVSDGKSSRNVELNIFQILNIENKNVRIIDVFATTPTIIEILHPNKNILKNYYSDNENICVLEYKVINNKHFIYITQIDIGNTFIIIDDGLKSISIPIKVENITNKFFVKNNFIIDIYDSTDTIYTLSFFNYASGVTTLDKNETDNLLINISTDGSKLELKRKNQNIIFKEIVKVTFVDVSVNYTVTIPITIESFNNTFKLSSQNIIFDDYDSVSQSVSVLNTQETVSITNNDPSIAETIFDITTKTITITPLKYGITTFNVFDSFNSKTINVNVVRKDWTFSSPKIVFLSIDDETTKVIKVLNMPMEGVSIINDYDRSKFDIVLIGDEIFISILTETDTHIKVGIIDYLKTIKYIDVYISPVISTITLTKVG